VMQLPWPRAARRARVASGCCASCTTFVDNLRLRALPCCPHTQPDGLLAAPAGRQAAAPGARASRAGLLRVGARLRRSTRTSPRLVFALRMSPRRAQPDAAAAYRPQAEQAVLRGEADDARAEAARLRRELAELRQQARSQHRLGALTCHHIRRGAAPSLTRRRHCDSRAPMPAQMGAPLGAGAVVRSALATPAAAAAAPAAPLPPPPPAAAATPAAAAKPLF
jgi:hypothetical protein